MRAALNPDRLRMVYDRAATRYDAWHALATARADQRGRSRLVRRCVRPGDRVLDAGGGTGLTTELAAEAAAPEGEVTLLDFSTGMLRRAAARLDARDGPGATVSVVSVVSGDMLKLPFRDECFDVVLSTYSVCPLFDPALGSAEMYRVLRPGGLLGVAHSSEPAHRMVRWVAGRVESIVWKWPQISLGCRPVSVLPGLMELGAEVLKDERIGVPLWPFRVFVVRKPIHGT